MIFYMDSKTFRNKFLVYEHPLIVRDAQYVLVSHRIKKRTNGNPKTDNFTNVVSFTKVFFPNEVLQSDGDVEDMDWINRYCEQLEKSKVAFAVILKKVIEENATVIFLCSHKENKLNYLDKIAWYVYKRFGYTMCKYTMPIYPCNVNVIRGTKKTLKICNKIIEAENDRDYEQSIDTVEGVEHLIDKYKRMSKKELKKEMKRRDIPYKKGMSKKEMVRSCKRTL